MQHQFRIVHLIAYVCFMMDLQGLRALVAVARTGSVVGAADQLGYTPSAVSQQVKKLERDLDAPLLERRGRGVLLTERGRALAAEGDDVLERLERLEHLGSDDEGPPAPLRIASFSTATRGLLGPVLRELRTPDGSALASVTSVDPFEAMELVATGAVDLAVVHNWNSVPLIAPAHVVTEHVCWDEADVVLPADHPLAGDDELERSALVGESWASTPRGAICHEALLRIFADLDALPRIVAEDTDFASLVELARHGVAISLLPRLGRSPLPDGVVARPLSDHSQVREVRVAYRRSMAQSPGIRRAVRLLAAAGAAVGPEEPEATRARQWPAGPPATTEPPESPAPTGSATG
jgi:DNA-binding transcriptional LysR family regulator